MLVLSLLWFLIPGRFSLDFPETGEKTCRLHGYMVMVPFLLKALHVPSRELTCPLPRHVWVDDFPFKMVGYVIVTWRVILTQKTAETPKNLSYQEEIYQATGQSKQLRDGMDRVEGDNFHGFIFCYLGNLTTVNGINPPPIDIINIPVFIGFYTSQLAQDFSYQQYGSWIPCSFWIRYLLSNMVIFQAAMIVFGGGVYIYIHISCWMNIWLIREAAVQLDSSWENPA